VVASFRFAGEAVGTIIGTNGIDFKAPLFEMIFSYEHGRIHFRDLDGEMEVIDYRAKRHERYACLYDSSRWDHYRSSFEKSLDAYLNSIRDNCPPPIPGTAGLVELQFEAALRRSIAEKRPVDAAAEFPLGLRGTDG
jgi:predicted dehydrogenase